MYVLLYVDGIVVFSEIEVDLHKGLDKFMITDGN